MNYSHPAQPKQLALSVVWLATVVASSDWRFVERQCKLLPPLLVPLRWLMRVLDSKHRGWSKVPGFAAVSKILESL